MHEWLLTPELTDEEKEMSLEKWLKIICDFAYSRDMKEFGKNDADNIKIRREKTIQVLKKIALKNNSDFNRAEFKYMTLA